MLLGAALGGVPAARAEVRFVRDDIAVPSSPCPSRSGLRRRAWQGHRDRAVQPGKVGVMLNDGDGTFGALQQYSAGPECVGQAVEIELGDVTGPAGAFVPDGKLDTYVACTPYVVRLDGRRRGGAGQPVGRSSWTPRRISAPRRSTSSRCAAPGRQPGPAARRCSIRSGASAVSCASAMSWIGGSSCAVPRRWRDRWPSATSTERSRGVPPDEIVTGLGAADTLASSVSRISCRR